MGVLGELWRDDEVARLGADEPVDVRREILAELRLEGLGHALELDGEGAHCCTSLSSGQTAPRTRPDESIHAPARRPRAIGEECAPPSPAFSRPVMQIGKWFYGNPLFSSVGKMERAKRDARYC